MMLPEETGNKWYKSMMEVERKCRHFLQTEMENVTFDGAYMMDLVGEMPANSNLIAGNSLPIRNLDQFGFATYKPINVFGNRGASGIDGVISTALGVAASNPTTPTILAIGDVSFYHNLNALHDIHQAKSPVIIILFNNNGGNIFRRLPIANFDPIFTDLFLTPHNLDFEPFIRGFGWQFHRVTDRPTFRDTFQRVVNNLAPTVIEIVTDGVEDEKCRQKIIQTIHIQLNHTQQITS
jgi:2-succinyl-5-enolpyruvyl-6-hydroxy-3-cyclohexene-1-carboxylate synthase